jgi:hypothetical protein
MKPNKDSSSTNGFNKRTVHYHQTKNRVKLSMIIIFILTKITKSNTELLHHKNGNQIQLKVLNSLNYYYQLLIPGELNTLSMLFLPNLNLSIHQLLLFKTVFY